MLDPGKCFKVILLIATVFILVWAITFTLDSLRNGFVHEVLSLLADIFLVVCGLKIWWTWKNRTAIRPAAEREERTAICPR